MVFYRGRRHRRSTISLVQGVQLLDVLPFSELSYQVLYLDLYRVV